MPGSGSEKEKSSTNTIEVRGKNAESLFKLKKSDAKKILESLRSKSKVCVVESYSNTEEDFLTVELYNLGNKKYHIYSEFNIDGLSEKKVIHDNIKSALKIMKSVYPNKSKYHYKGERMPLDVYKIKQFVAKSKYKEYYLGSELDKNDEIRYGITTAVKDSDKFDLLTETEDSFYKCLEDYIIFLIPFINSLRMITPDSYGNISFETLFEEIPISEIDESVYNSRILPPDVASAKGGEGVEEIKENGDKFGDYDVLSLSKKDYGMENIGGYEDVKEELILLIDSIKNPKKYKKFGLKKEKGVILFGKPGTGKTLFAKAVSAESGVRFIPVSYSTFIQKYVGESEKKIAKLFTDLHNSKESTILFIDEADGLFESRMSGSSHNNTVVNTFLECLDGIKSKDNITVIAATNFEENIDPAIKRSGRLATLEIPMPDLEAREAIWKIHLGKKPKKVLSKNIDIKLLSSESDGYSGADIENAINSAIKSRYKEAIKENKSSMPKFVIDNDDLIKMLQEVKKEVKVGFVTK